MLRTVLFLVLLTSAVAISPSEKVEKKFKGYIYGFNAINELADTACPVSPFYNTTPIAIAAAEVVAKHFSEAHIKYFLTEQNGVYSINITRGSTTSYTPFGPVASSTGAEFLNSISTLITQLVAYVFRRPTLKLLSSTVIDDVVQNNPDFGGVNTVLVQNYHVIVGLQCNIAQIRKQEFYVFFKFVYCEEAGGDYKICGVYERVVDFLSQDGSLWTRH